MAKLTRGFLGRGREARDPRLPPCQYDIGDGWPVLTAEVTPHPWRPVARAALRGRLSDRRRQNGPDLQE